MLDAGKELVLLDCVKCSMKIHERLAQLFARPGTKAISQFRKLRH